MLNASRRRTQDRATFFRAQLLFWLLCAPDGYAKNFSIVLHAGGAFSRAPLYDVVSAYPVLGRSRNQILPQRVKLAMALRSRCALAHARHPSPALAGHGPAKRHRVGRPTRRGLADRDLIEKTPEVIAAVSAKLLAEFPAHVGDSIIGGLRTAVKRLEAASGPDQ